MTKCEQCNQREATRYNETIRESDTSAKIINICDVCFDKHVKSRQSRTRGSK